MPPSPATIRFPPIADEDIGRLSQQGSVFASLGWFELLARTSMPDHAQALYLCCEGTGTEDAACVPLLRRKARGRNRLEGLSNFYSSIYHPISTEPLVLRAANDLAIYAATAKPGIDVVDLRPLDASSTFFFSATKALQAQGFWTDSYFCFGNWYLEVAGKTFEEYFQTRPSQLRNTARRGRKKLEAQNLQIEVYTQNSPELEAAISNYEAIYNSSWKQPEPFPSFIPELCRMTAARGWLRLGVLSLGDKPVAAQIWFVKDGTASIFKLAYIEEYAKQTVGTVLTTELMRRAIDEDKVEIVDYLSGDDPYKKDWMTHRRERRGIIAFSQRRTLGIYDAVIHFAAKALKSFRAKMGKKSN